SMRDTIEPVGNLLSACYRGSLADKNQKGGLKRILCIGLLMQDTSAYTHDHAPVPTQQGFEGGLIAVIDVPAKQLPIAQPGSTIDRDRPTNVLDDPICPMARHTLSLTQAPVECHIPAPPAWAVLYQFLAEIREMGSKRAGNLDRWKRAMQ